MSKAFASQADLEEKQVSFTKLSDNAYAYTAEGDPNTGIDRRRRRGDGDRHAGHAGDGAGRHPPHPRGHRQADQVRRADPLPRGARARRQSRYAPEHIIASQRHLRPDRRARRAGHEERDRALSAPVPRRRIGAPGLTWPTITFKGEMTLWLGKLEVQLMQLGRGHTKGDTVVWLPQQKILFSRRPRRVRRHAVRRRRLLHGLAADARQHRRAAARRAGARPRRGADDAASGASRASTARAPSSADMYASVQAGVAAGKDLQRGLQGDATRR